MKCKAKKLKPIYVILFHLEDNQTLKKPQIIIIFTIEEPSSF